MIRINRDISINEREIGEEFIRSSGPGGQNVNKVATGVQLRFDVRNSPSLTDEVRQRLVKTAGRRMTMRGVLVIKAVRFRTQERNRQDALTRLKDLIRKAAQKPKKRRKTRPTAASKKKRLETKRRRGKAKGLRARIQIDEE
jgi:ribosome-associated protein